MMPSNWQEDTLSNVLDKIIDYRGQSVPKAERGVPLITARNVRFGYLDLGSKEFIDESQFEKWNTRGTPMSGDILFTTEAPLGMACRFPDSGTYGVGQRTVTLRTNHKLSSEFLLYFLLSERGQRLIDIRSSGSTAKGIKSSELKKVKILHPICVEEQRKIAKVLSTWDKAISTTERLIENSKQQKKSLMQQLLTAKKRLLDDSGKPFESEWGKKPFKNILRLDRGSSPRPIVKFMTQSEDGVNWIKIGDTKEKALFIDSTKEKITKEGAKKSRKVTKGEIIVSNSMSYGKPYILKIDGYIHDGWFVIRDYQEHLDTNFLIQVLGSEFIQAQYKRLAAGGVVTNISSDIVYSVKINLPSIKEQQKIAEVLTIADKEIELFEQQLDDLKQEKKALMQQLLTGKKRVTV